MVWYGHSMKIADQSTSESKPRTRTQTAPVDMTAANATSAQLNGKITLLYNRGMERSDGSVIV